MTRLSFYLYAILSIGTACLGAPAAAHASVMMVAHGASLSYQEFSGDGDLSAFDVVIDEVSGLTPLGVAQVSLGFGFSVAAPNLSFGGGLMVLDDAGLLLGGDLVTFASAPNTIIFSLGVLDGTAAAIFNGLVAGVIEFQPFLASDPLAALRDGEVYTATIRLTGSPVSVSTPGGLWLAIAGLMAMMPYRRFKRLTARIPGRRQTGAGRGVGIDSAENL